MSDSVQDREWSLYLHACTLQLIFWLGIYINPFMVVVLAKYENLYIDSQNTLNIIKTTYIANDSTGTVMEMDLTEKIIWNTWKEKQGLVYCIHWPAFIAQRIEQPPPKR